MLNRRSYILLFWGLAGILSYFLLRADIEFYASGPISESKGQVEEKIGEIALQLGFSADSLAMMSTRKQHLSYTKILQDTIIEEPSPAALNKRGFHIQSWETVLGAQNKSNGVFAAPGQLFDETGRLKINTANSGKIIRINSNNENPNPTFIQGDSLFSIAEKIVGDILGYDLGLYELKENNIYDSVSAVDEGLNQRRERNNGRDQKSLEIVWNVKADTIRAPEKLILRLQPIVREINDESGFRTQFGFTIQSFSALDSYEPEDLKADATNNSDDLLFSYILFSALFLLIILIFAVGLRNIFKGKVEWRRALVIFIAISAGVYGWRAIYYIYSYHPFLSTAGIFAGTINNLVFGLVVGLYAALAYISWEALARSQGQHQVAIIDALWQRKFFVSETGSALVHGFAFGGIVIGIISSILYFSGEFLIQSDSQFGFSEASITPKLLTINMSSWTTTWLVCIAQIGFVYSILQQWIKREWLASLISIVISGICITVLGRLIETSGPIFLDMLIYLSIAVIFIYAIKEFGLLTVCTGWWFFTVFLMIQPYIGSSSIEVAYVGWVQSFIMAGPFIYGFIAYRYGVSVSEVGDYIPEYEERIAQHLWVEKEIEIARESQYKLMPLKAPKVDGIDVYGFFLPSFEVGGDYFDYVMSEDKFGNPTALNMTVVDVSGKAMRAAMPAVFTSGLLLSRMKDDMPSDILSRITEPIFYRTDKRTFITCALARYEFETMKMSIANAGHCRPVLKRNGIAEYIHTPAPAYPLGIKKNVTYRAETIAMKKGDFFLLYSDGLPEAVNEKGERFGFEEVPRLIESIDTDLLSAYEIVQEIKRTVQKFSNYQLVDDTTIICLKI
ncbi:MAG: serine/threonine-protein phosphatase [Gracilimonas sp.]|uniref:PP2C family protein-serine/threonine phosphatase n=1 Tax=Gracilimonas sp. TaxID=1974203 RepID=UPI0037508B46|nr:serine/threonine-protein phosphatase [Gracilimonas sp.]